MNRKTIVRCFFAAILLILISQLVSARSDASLRTVSVPLPGGEGGIGFDDLGFSPNLHKVIVPGGRTGRLFMIDPMTREIQDVLEFSARPKYHGGHGDGTTSADEGEGFLFAIDRNSQTVDIVDPAARKIIGSARLASGPDYVRYVRPTHEVWVTEPDSEMIEVFSSPSGKKPSLVRLMSIPVSGGPESLVIDGGRGRAYTHLWSGSTVVIDLKTHAVVATWPNGCGGSRGIALDEKRGFLFVGCAEGKAVVLDVGHDGEVLGNLSAGSGVDVIAYNPSLSHLYLPGAKSATLAIIKVSEEGGLSLLGTAETAQGSHCATADDQGQIWVCDPNHGQLLLVKDPFQTKTP